MSFEAWAVYNFEPWAVLPFRSQGCFTFSKQGLFHNFELKKASEIEENRKFEEKTLFAFQKFEIWAVFDIRTIFFRR